MPCWTVTGSSGQAGQASPGVGVVVGMMFTFGDGMIESLWVRTRAQKIQMSLWEFTMDYLARIKTLINYSSRKREISKSTSPVLIGGFNLLYVNWEHHTAGTNRSRRLLKHLDDNFMAQVVGELTRKDVLLDLFHGNREGFTGELVAIMGAAITKQSGLKPLLTGEKVLAKLQPCT